MRRRRWAREWSQDPYDTSLLVSGFSLGEGLAVVAVVGILTGLAVSPGRDSIDRFKVTEALWLSVIQKLDWIEQWATDGDMPVHRSQVTPKGATLRLVTGLYFDKPDAYIKHLSGVDLGATDGMVVFTMNAPASQQTVSFRPAFGPGVTPATIIWLCGRASVPPGFARLGEDRTSLSNEKLPSPCRGDS